MKKSAAKSLPVVKKAVVLAAGLGTRLRPLTCIMPKPLLPICGKPMLERIILMLESWGVEEIAVNASWLPEQVSSFAAERKGKAKITVSVEPEILGTGGVLRPLEKFIGDSPFWLVNGDVVCDKLDPAPIQEAFHRGGDFAACWMSETAGPRTVEADPEGRICNWASEDSGLDGTYTYCGVALLSPAILNYLPASGFATIVSAYEKAMMTDARFVVGVTEQGAFWGDAGTFARYLEIHAALDPDAFDANPNVLFDGVKLAPSADLTGCVVTGGLVGGTIMRAAVVGVSQLHDRALSALTAALGWKEEDAAAIFLGARGSDRSFWRLIRGDDRAIAIIYDDAKRPENARYASHTHILAKAGVPVPKVLADVPEIKAVALEDLGDDSLENRVKKTASGASGIVALYTPVVQAIAKMHCDGTAAALAADAKLEPAFGPDLYAWERDLFESETVKGRFGFDGFPADVRAELEGVAKTLEGARPVLVHRDFQCSNVLFRADGSFAFIDFQGMRLGAAAYDLASLLYDPYATVSESDRAALARVYAKAAPDISDAVSMLHIAAVQRLVQALGAFGRLSAAGHPEFSKRILPALGNLLAAADEAGLDAVGAFAEDLIAREKLR